MLYCRRLIAEIILICTFSFLLPFLSMLPISAAQTLTPDDIIKLKEAGVSDEVILEMIKRGKGVQPQERTPEALEDEKKRRESSGGVSATSRLKTANESAIRTLKKFIEEDPRKPTFHELTPEYLVATVTRCIYVRRATFGVECLQEVKSRAKAHFKDIDDAKFKVGGWTFLSLPHFGRFCFKDSDVEYEDHRILAPPRTPGLCLEIHVNLADDVSKLRTALETLSGKPLSPVE